MDSRQKLSFEQQISDYKYMMLLKHKYETPRMLLCCPLLPSLRKKYLLKRWRDDRTRYILENCRDYDYLSDQEMEELLAAVKIVKALLSMQDSAQVKIRLFSED
jgi:hypothetical protein